MAFAALQEGVFKCVCAQVLRRPARAAPLWSSSKCCLALRIDGFRYGGWMTFVTSAWFCVCAGLELLVSGETQRKGTWRVRADLFFVLLRVAALADACAVAWRRCAGLLHASGIDNLWDVLDKLVWGHAPLLPFCAAWFGLIPLPIRALNFLNYSTRIVFKSSKVVPTMILGTVLQGRRYDMQEYAAAALLVAGVSLFCLGDVAVAPNFHIAGVGLITLALFADAATSNFEEKRFFRIANPVSQAEVIFYSSAISSLAGFAVLLPTRELGPAWQHSRANSVVVPLLSAAAVCGYLRCGDARS